MTIALPQEPSTLDLTTATDDAAHQVLYANVVEGLTRIGPDGVKSGLASHWQVSDDGLSYVFFVRPEVLFHDRTEMVVEDVVTALERAQPGMETVASITALDDQSLRIILSEPDPDILRKLAAGPAAVAVAGHAEQTKYDPLGTGAFKVADWSEGQQIVLTINQFYWSNPARLDRVKFLFLEEAEAIAALEAGDVDTLIRYPASDALRALAAGDAYQSWGDGDDPISLAKQGLNGLWDDIPAQLLDLTKVHWSK